MTHAIHNATCVLWTQQIAMNTMNHLSDTEYIFIEFKKMIMDIKCSYMSRVCISHYVVRELLHMTPASYSEMIESRGECSRCEESISAERSEYIKQERICSGWRELRKARERAGIKNIRYSWMRESLDSEATEIWVYQDTSSKLARIRNCKVC